MIRKCVRRALVLLATALFSQAALAQVSEADFTRQMAERFRAAMPGRTVEISGPLQLRYGTGADGGVVNVGRVFADCASAKRPRIAIITMSIARRTSMPFSFGALGSR